MQGKNRIDDGQRSGLVGKLEFTPNKERLFSNI